jgi:hypothetical protein
MQANRTSLAAPTKRWTARGNENLSGRISPTRVAGKMGADFRMSEEWGRHFIGAVPRGREARAGASELHSAARVRTPAPHPALCDAGGFISPSASPA